jgi:predicted transcriptional regulator
MIIKKTLKTKLSYLTHIKESLIQKEFDNFQLALHAQSHELYSATSQQADRLLRKLKGEVKNKFYPMILRRDTIKVEKRDTKISQYWFKIPIAKVRGGIWCALDIPKNENITQYDIRECKILKKNVGLCI